jgi:hypothetical protein
VEIGVESQGKVDDLAVTVVLGYRCSANIAELSTCDHVYVSESILNLVVVLDLSNLSASV